MAYEELFPEIKWLLDQTPDTSAIINLNLWLVF